MDRKNVLRAINSMRMLEHPGFVLLDCAEMIPPKLVTHSDGSATVDLQCYIILPSNCNDWTDEIIRAAYDEFAKLSRDDFHDLTKPVVHGLYITKEALAAYCDEIGCNPPGFWFSAERGKKWTARRQRQAEAWLKAIASGPKRKPKSAYFTDAVKEFQGLPRKAFNRIWDRVVPLSWKRSGPVVGRPRHE
jgi:hypothetical protein